MKLRRLVAVALVLALALLLLPLAGCHGSNPDGSLTRIERLTVNVETVNGVMAGLTALRSEGYVDDDAARAIEAGRAKAWQGIEDARASIARGDPDLPLSPYRAAVDAFEAGLAELLRAKVAAQQIKAASERATTRRAVRPTPRPAVPTGPPAAAVPPTPQATPAPAALPSGGPVD